MKESITGHVKLYESGSRIDVNVHYTKFKNARNGGGKRGKIGGFSPASRKRLIELLTSLDQTALKQSLFVTLTYKRNHVEPKKCKRDLKHFLQALRRAFPTSSGIWKLEFQERGTPHYHLIIFERYIDYKWVAHHWNLIAENGDPAHYEAGTQVVAISKARNACAYLSKYMGKVIEQDDSSHQEPGKPAMDYGRFWGIMGSANLPRSSVRIIPLGGNEARAIIEHQVSIWGNGFSGDQVSSISIFTNGANDSIKKLRDYNVGL